MWELDHKEGWALKNWCFQNMMLEKTLESPLDIKETKPVGPKGNQPWIFIGRTDAKLKLQYFGHLKWRANSLEKIPMLGKTEGMRRRRWQRMRWLDGINNSMDMNLANSGRWWRTGSLGMPQSMGLQRVRHDSWLNNNNMGYLHEISLREWLINHEATSALWKSNP